MQLLALLAIDLQIKIWQGLQNCQLMQRLSQPVKYGFGIHHLFTQKLDGLRQLLGILLINIGKDSDDIGLVN